MSGYIGNIPVPQATQTRQSFTATASQTTFNTAGYSVGYVDVFLNGVKLAPADYTATNGSDIILAVGAASGDILEIVAYEIFQVVDQDFTGDFTVDGTTFVVDSTNNRVGIGLTPSKKLDVDTTMRVTNASGTSAAELDVSSGSTWRFRAQPTTGTNAYGLDIVRGSAGTDVKMSIDSSGNLLVGKTASSLNNDGFQAHNTGYIGSTNSGASTAYFNRKTNDGDIVNFQKDGTTVGSIGNSGNDFYVTGSVSNIAGVTFANSKMMPMRSGSPADGQSDLGSSSYRWRDAYLSGGVYLGGTGASNQLSDYETGTWTPEMADASSGGTVATGGIKAGRYVKIGKMVHIYVVMLNMTTSSLGSSSNLYIRNLPFTPLGSGTTYPTAAIKMSQVTFSGYCTAQVQQGSTSIVINETTSGATYDFVECGQVNSGTNEFLIQAAYEVN